MVTLLLTQRKAVGTYLGRSGSRRQASSDDDKSLPTSTSTRKIVLIDMAGTSDTSDDLNS